MKAHIKTSILKNNFLKRYKKNYVLGCRPMWTQNAKQKTNSQLQKSFRFLSS